MYPELTPWLLALFAAAVAVVLVLLGRTVLRRLALRQIVRRPTETLLVSLGSVLGTALIVASLVVGDSLDRSVRQTAYDVLGPIDETVQSASLELGDDVAQRLEPLADDPDVDGVLTVRSAQAPAVAEIDDRVVAEPRALVWEVDFAAAATFGAPDASGLTVDEPRAEEVVINDNLADRLGVVAGDTVSLHLYGRAAVFTITEVVPAKGLAGMGLGASANYNVFVPPDTLVEAATSVGQEPMTTTLVSNRGGVEDGVELTGDVTNKIHEALGPLDGAAIATPKQEILDEAAEVSDVLGSMFLFIGSFCIIAGVLLLVNVFVMLAGERRGQLGVMRAIGLRRRYVTGEFAIECAVYATAAALIGAVLGIGIGRVVVILAMGILNSFESGENQLEIVFAVTPTSLANGVAAGFVIAFITVVLTSIKIARTNIIAAIRDLTLPVRRRTRTRLTVLSIVATIGFAAAAVPAVTASEATTTYLLPTLAALSAVPLLTRLMSLRSAMTVTSVGILAWGLLANTARPAMFDETSVAPYVVLGCILAFAAVTLVSLHQQVLLRPLRRLVERPTQNGLATRLAIAYPTAKTFRTGATLGMYSVVVLMIVIMAQVEGVINASVDSTVEDATAGWPIRVDYNPDTPIGDPATLERGEFADRVTDVVPLSVSEAEGTDPRLPEAEAIPILAVGAPTQLASRPIGLDTYLPSVPTEQAAWELVLSDPQYVFVDSLYGSSGGGPPGALVEPGSKIAVTDARTGTVSEFTVAGVISDGTAFYNATNTGLRYPVLMSEAALNAAFGSGATQSSALLGVAPGENVTDLVADLQGAFLSSGLVATDLAQAVEDSYTATNQFFRLMQGYLALGLLVGIISLGVIMVRAVRERRRDIGVLRALGFHARTLRKAFLVESTFVAVEGLIIGTVLGVATTWVLIRNSDAFEMFDGPFPIAWTQILLLLGATLLASLLATIGPARRAAAIRPAVSVRVAD